MKRLYLRIVFWAKELWPQNGYSYKIFCWCIKVSLRMRHLTSGVLNSSKQQLLDGAVITAAQLVLDRFPLLVELLNIIYERRSLQSKGSYNSWQLPIPSPNCVFLQTSSSPQILCMSFFNILILSCWVTYHIQINLRPCHLNSNFGDLDSSLDTA